MVGGGRSSVTDSVHSRNKDAIRLLRRALYDFDPEDVSRALADVFIADAPVHLAHPFEDLDGPRFGTFPK